MNSIIKQIQIFNNLGRTELKEALEAIEPYKKDLELKLKENHNDNELLDKIIELNRIIETSKALLNCEFGEFHKLYSKLYPEFTDENGNINEKGIERLVSLKNKRDNIQDT